MYSTEIFLVISSLKPKTNPMELNMAMAFPADGTAFDVFGKILGPCHSHCEKSTK